MRRVWTAAGAAVLVFAVGCGGSSSANPTLFCSRLERLTENDPFRSFGARATTAELQAAFDALRTSAHRLAAVAPDEARAAAHEYAGAVDRMRSLMAGARFDGARVDASAYRAAQLDYFTAAGRLERYLAASCGSTTTSR